MFFGGIDGCYPHAFGVDRAACDGQTGNDTLAAAVASADPGAASRRIDRSAGNIDHAAIAVLAAANAGGKRSADRGNDAPLDADGSAVSECVACKRGFAAADARADVGPLGIKRVLGTTSDGHRGVLRHKHADAGCDQPVLADQGDMGRRALRNIEGGGLDVVMVVDFQVVEDDVVGAAEDRYLVAFVVF